MTQDAALPKAIIVAGPTASGKSALAIAIARRLGGVIINADSMQVYRELRIVTARPTAVEEAQTPHRLYGVRAAADPGSAAWWREAVLAEMAAAHAAGQLPIICGGTGMYFAALLNGLADIPDPGPEAREEARRLLAVEGPAALHTRLTIADPITAARLKPTDSQRLARAWEVFIGTGHGMTYWHTPGHAQASPPAPWHLKAILLDPPRADLRAAIATRFTAMLDEGVVEEIRALLAQNLDPALPAMRAHGVPELVAHLRGQTTLAEAAARAEIVTGQYTKRQATWFRHHELSNCGPAHMIRARFANLAQFSESELAEMFNFIQGRT